MYRPKNNAGRVGRLEISPSPEPQQPTAPNRCGDLEPNHLPSLSTARPLRRNTRPGLISVSGPQAAQPPSRPARSVLPGITSISTADPNWRPPRISDLPTLQNARPARARPEARTMWSAIRRGGPPQLSSLSSEPTAQPAQHPIPHSYRSVGVQVNLPPPPAPPAAPPPVPPSATRESRSAVTATPKRAPWRPPRESTPFRPVKKGTPSGHAPDTAINQPEATITSPDTATNAPAAAPIHEFICLYSHDLRRKQKRWQDGILKFHTFNQKFMVYDENGVYVGEGHWQGDVDEFQEGIEIKLDRPMAWLQVMECTGTKEQDLSQVLGKRVREVEERRAARAPARRNREVAPPVELVSQDRIIPLTPPRNVGAWSKHAEDLLGRGRPIRR